MSEETRTADATLTAYARSRRPGAWCVAVVNAWGDGIPAAHRTKFVHGTGAPDYRPAHLLLACNLTRKVRMSERHLTKFARWYARPCRHCWPEASS